MAIRFFSTLLYTASLRVIWLLFFPFSNNLMEEKSSVRLHTVALLIYIVWDFGCMSVFCDSVGTDVHSIGNRRAPTILILVRTAYTHTRTQRWYKYTKNPNEFYANEKGEKSRTKTESLYFDYKRIFFLWFFVEFDFSFSF